MKGEEWWSNLLGQMEAYGTDSTAKEVIARLSELGHDAAAMYVIALRHAAKEPGLDDSEIHNNAAWMCFGIEMGIRAERALQLERDVT